MERNFLEYASYVILDRAIPDIRDGLKPVQRRILHTLKEMDDGKLHKVANVIGETMKLHPHGDASIGDALVNLANKEYFIDKQGNFGNLLTGHAAAAPRYIECRLTELAKDTLFSKVLTQYKPSYDGRREEPVFLPAKLPIILLQGTDGIAVGMATHILPHNLKELLQAQIAILQGKQVTVYPDFPGGGIADVSEYDQGRGKIKVRALIEKADDKTLIIREIPYSVTTEKLIESIEAANLKGNVKINSIDDFTTYKVEIQIGLPRGVYADEVLPQLYAYTNCEVNLTSNIVVIKDNHPCEMTVNQLLEYLTDCLRDLIQAELQYNLGQAKEKKHWLSLEAIFIENRIYKRIEEAKTEQSVHREIMDGLAPFVSQLERQVNDEDLQRLLALPIRRISLFDINRNRQAIKDVLAEINTLQKKLKHLNQTVIEYLEGLIKKYGEKYPRRTRIEELQTVDIKSVARQNIKVAYDPESGFFGSEVKAGGGGSGGGAGSEDARYQFSMSEYDRILVICQDGSFKIIGPESKILIPGKVLYMDIFDQEKGQRFCIIYRDGQRKAFAKLIHIQKFVRDKEYELIKDKAGKIDHLIPVFTIADAVAAGIVPESALEGTEEDLDRKSKLTEKGTDTSGADIDADGDKGLNMNQDLDEAGDGDDGENEDLSDSITGDDEDDAGATAADEDDPDKATTANHQIADSTEKTGQEKPDGTDLVTATGKRLPLVTVQFIPRPRQRKAEEVFDLELLQEVGIYAKGSRMTAKPVQRIKLTRTRAKIQTKNEGDSEDEKGGPGPEYGPGPSSIDTDSTEAGSAGGPGAPGDTADVEGGASPAQSQTDQSEQDPQTPENGQQHKQLSLL